MKTSAFLIFLLVLFFCVSAQRDSLERGRLRAGFQTSAVPVTDVSAPDSVRLQWYIAPQLSYIHNSGLGILLRTYLLSNKLAAGSFLTTISPNFEKDNSVLYTELSYSHFFYRAHTTVTYSPIKNELYGNIRLKQMLLQPLLTLNAGWGKDSSGAGVSDINVLAGITHEFNVTTGKNSNLSLLPAIILNAATNRYFSLLQGSPYISHSKNYNALVHGRNKTNRGNQGNSNNTNATDASPAFGLSQLETNLYCYYSIGKCTLEPDASIYFPLHTGGTVAGYFQLTANFHF